MKHRILLILMGLSLLPALLISATLCVKQDGSGDYTIIQEALNAANPGDTVLVHPGRYFENLVINKSNITLMSLEGTTGDDSYIDSTVIDGGGIQRCVAVSRDKKQLLLRGFSITNGFSTGGAGGIGLAVNTSSHLCNLKIFSNTAATGGGINIGAASVLLSGIDLYDNYALQLGGGIFAASGEGYINNISFDPINRCSIYNNRAGSGQDIYIQHAANDLELPLNTFSVANPSNYHAVYLSKNPLSNNHRINFDIQNAHHQELDCDIYVSTTGSDDNDGFSPETALKTIHEAIYRVAADSLNQNTVHILPGTYSRTDNEQIFPIALKSWVVVQGGGIETTTVICEPHPTVPLSYGYWDKLFKATRVDGATLANMTFLSRDTMDCGVLLGNYNSTINLINLHIDEFYPDYAAIIRMASSSIRETMWDNVTIENITTNDAGLISILLPISGTIKNCVFRNSASMYESASIWADPLIRIVGDKHLSFENCEFSNLTMQDDDTVSVSIGGVQYPQQHNHFSFQNCLFSNNSSQGGVVTVSSSNNPRIDITNCTFAGNTSDNFTLRINGDVNITNSIFYNDSPFQIKVDPMDGNPNEYTHLKIDHSLIKGGLSGIQAFPVPWNTIDFLPSSFDADPLFQGFVVPSNPFHYVLSELSPCIDSGTPDLSGLNLPPYDLAGNYRVWGSGIDLGCYEYGSEPWVSVYDPVLPALEQLVLQQNYPNPFNPSTTISYSLPKAAKLRLDIYNIKGQLVKTLVNSEMPAGTHSIVWNGRDMKNKAVATGVYFYRISSPKEGSKTKKMMLMK